MSEARGGKLGRAEWIALALVFLLALALRAGCALQYTRSHPQADFPVIDEESYERWALAIAGGEWLGNEVFFQEPLYPYCLGALYALFGHDRLLARLAQCVLGALACALTALLGRRVFGSRAGLLAGLGLALHRPAVLLPSLLLKENLFLPLLALLVLLAIGATSAQRGRWALIGWIAGLGALLRGNMLVLLPCVIAWPLVRDALARSPLRRAAGSAACALAGTLLALLPVAWRNLHVGGVFALTTSGAGTNLYGGNNPENPLGVASEFSFVRGIPSYEADDWRREAERRVGRPLDAGEVSRFWTRELWRSVREQPGLHLSILWNKLRLSLGPHEVPDNHSLAWDSRYVFLLRLPLPGFALGGALGLAGLLVLLARAARRGRRAELRPGLELALCFLLYLGTIVLTVTSMRARLPLVPLLLPFAGQWLVEGARLLRRGGARSALALHLFALAPAGLFAWMPVLDAGARARELAGRDYNLAVQYLEREERVPEAAAIAARLVERDPANPRFQTLAASIEWRQGVAARAAGREEEGRELVRSALARLAGVAREGRANPREMARASRLAGWIQLELASYAAAERHFRRARDFARDDPELLFEHAQALVLFAEHTAPGAERARSASEAESLLDALPPTSAGPALDDLRARLARLR